jgi:hypothetical protein
MFRNLVPVLGGRRVLVAALLVAAGLLSPRTASAQQWNGKLGPDAGMILNYIKPDKAADFEAVLAKVKEGLTKSTKPERNAQAKAWKVFKSPDPANGNVLYIFILDPAVKDAEYTISNILAESFPPAEVNDLYKKYAEAYASGQAPVNLSLVNDFSK